MYTWNYGQIGLVTFDVGSSRDRSMLDQPWRKNGLSVYLFKQMGKIASHTEKEKRKKKKAKNKIKTKMLYKRSGGKE